MLTPSRSRRDPRVAPPADHQWVVDELVAARVLIEDVPSVLASYAYDASNYRVPPLAVVFPRSAHEVALVVAACRRAGISITSRGGGTSMAGNAIGPGFVIDFSREMRQVVRVDETAAIADVESGVVLSQLASEVERVTHGRLTFAPDPSSRSRATIGGAIGNDACGNRSVRHGRMSDHVIELDLVTSDGHRLTTTNNGIRATDPAEVGAVTRAAEMTKDLLDLTQSHLARVRTELGRLPRQVSGFHLHRLLPENGFDVARSLAGSEGTCAIVTGARVRLVPTASRVVLLCLGYDDVVEAARDIETILEFGPAAVEGIDREIVETVRVRRGADALGGLPAGSAFVYVELDDHHGDDSASTANVLLTRLRGLGRLRDSRTVSDPAEVAALWRVREDGAGLSFRPASGGLSWPGWEDSAVPVARLADYVAELRTVLRRHELDGIMYGHFGAGCIHIRVTYDLQSVAGRATFRAFTTEAAKLVTRYGGSLSGEHGDGRARSELLPIMYSREMMTAFERFRSIWDPVALLSPGVITSPDDIDDHLALDGVPQHNWDTHFAYPHVDAATAPWASAVQSCIGVGRCRSDSGGVMCPSYRATGEERDSTRGRARALQEMIREAPTPKDGWKSRDVLATLDLCLSCKACSNDCPTGVDMATYKSEFLAQHFRRRLRPITHFTLGWLPFWLKLTSRASRVVNALMSSPLRRPIARLGGITTHRRLPRFASQQELQRELAEGGQQDGPASMLLFIDSFTKGFRPDVVGAALRVADDAGVSVACETGVCCGLPWISTGQLRHAARLMRQTVSRLDTGDDTPIVVLEPSCAATLRKDLPELLGDEASERVATRVRSWGQAVSEWVGEGWEPPEMPASVIVQSHCHEYATFGSTVQRTALHDLGVAHVREATGCCGVAGNFGFEAEHYQLSVQIAEQGLLPALRENPDTVVLTDGFSCAMQVDHLDSARRTLHLAQLIDEQFNSRSGAEVSSRCQSNCR